MQRRSLRTDGASYVITGQHQGSGKIDEPGDHWTKSDQDLLWQDKDVQDLNNNPAHRD